jgi:hypothetical protein
MNIETHEAMGQALIERGLATQEAVAADRVALEKVLASGEESAPEVTADQAGSSELPNDANVNPIDAEAFKAPASPSSYAFDRLPSELNNNPEQEVVMRDFFYQEGIPVSIAKEINRLYVDGLKTPPTEQQLNTSKENLMATLSKVWGKERDSNIALAQREVARMAQTTPKIIDMLNHTGIGNNPWLIQTIVNMAKAKGRQNA